MSTLVITHTAAAGTLLRGTQKGDGTNIIAKKHRLRWSRRLAAWYVPHSRDRLPRARLIDHLADDLRAAGHQVDLDVDHQLRSVQEAEQARRDRLDEHVGRLNDRARAAQRAAEIANDRHLAAVDQLPTAGEPIKRGHHSERRHRRTIAAAHTAADNALKADDALKAAQAAAATAQTAADRRLHPLTVARRIDRLTLERRVTKRELDRLTSPNSPRATRLHQRLARLDEEITYWQDLRCQQIAAGEATDFQGTVNRGDRVEIRGNWYTVVRPNRTTVTVDVGPWNTRYPWHEITAHLTITEDHR